MKIENISKELTDIRNDIQNGDDITKLSSYMKSNSVQKLVNKLVQMDEIDEEFWYVTKVIIDCAQIIYNYSGQDTGISDSDYDIIYEKLSDSGFVDLGITVPIPDSKKGISYHKFKTLRGTLDKIYQLTEDDILHNKSRKSLDDWVSSSERRIKEISGQEIDLYNEDVYAFPKWDGVSVIFEYGVNGIFDRALTRGFTERNEAQDISHILLDIGKSLGVGPTGLAYGIKTEVMMSEDDLVKYNKEHGTNYKNSRSIVSSILNSDEKDERVDYLKVMPLRTSSLNMDKVESFQSLHPSVFNTPFIGCKLKDIDKLREFAMNHKFVNGLRCDGMVIYLRNKKLQETLGRENDKMKYEVAFKFTEETGYSKVVNINFSAGLFGRINPVLQVEPVKLKGNTIENISMGSIPRMQSMNLSKGDTVKVLYDIIPYVIFDEDDEKCVRSGNIPIPVPKECPDCGEELLVDGGILQCKNKKCPCRIKGKILNYLKKMRIQGIGYGIVEQLYAYGYLKSISDIYKLEDHKKALSKLPNFGSLLVSNMIEEINTHLEVLPSDLLGSIGIEGAGRKKFRKVFTTISFDELLDFAMNNDSAGVAVLTTIPGIGEHTAEKILSGIKQNEDLILYLEEKLTLLDEKSMRAKFKVVFTKIRDAETEKWVEVNQGEVQDNVTKETDIVIIPEKGVTSGSTKTADKYGIPVVPINEFREYVREFIFDM